jgi:ATP-dependent Clp protease adaptor protein ClpS
MGEQNGRHSRFLKAAFFMGQAAGLVFYPCLAMIGNLQDRSGCEKARDKADRRAEMSPTATTPKTKTKPKTQRPPLWKVILLNDDFTPREFVVQVLKAVFRLNESQSYRVMMTAHQKGACVIAVYTRDVAETKAKEATELGKMNGFPLYFTTEKEE